MIAEKLPLDLNPITLGDIQLVEGRYQHIHSSWMGTHGFTFVLQSFSLSLSLRSDDEHPIYEAFEL